MVRDRESNVLIDVMIRNAQDSVEGNPCLLLRHLVYARTVIDGQKKENIRLFLCDLSWTWKLGSDVDKGTFEQREQSQLKVNFW